MKLANLVQLLPLATSALAIKTITRDVTVIGGGVGGTYAAVRVADYNKSVVVVEQTETLGGATRTYHDPATGETIDVGVQIFQNMDIVKSFFARYNLPLINMSIGISGAGGGLIPVNLRTGQHFNYSVLPSDDNVASAFKKYAAQLARFPFLTDPGIQLPDPVPEDLLLPFSKFVDKYDLQDIVQLVALQAQGFGNVLETTTLYVFKFFNEIVLENLASSFLASATTNSHELYEKAYDALGGAKNVLFNSTIISIDRPAKSDPDAPIKLYVQSSSTGEIVQINTKQIVFAIPPVASNFETVDLDETEDSLISRFTSHTFMAGVLKNAAYLEAPGLLYNADLTTPYKLPKLPSIYFIGPMFGNLTAIPYGGPSPPDPEDEEDIKKDVISLVKKSIPGSDPEIVSWMSGGNYECQVSADEIRGGFYERLNNLQGYRNTWWTGAAFQHPDCALIWNFTDAVVIPNLIKALNA
ncbi:uncharacterized protein TRUGW13939_02354 [Talaromyces rugulosus]|uniref:Amine oxidase domain-containing protein n=1 Tax=Talaromyces rugulosus TaxID=121627 RepID=A0A7H8QN47_TALRU|nr:uncharacterized protein TRUGW13939_02354 [Talaromyces rugulosus]QKX55262.1 hypothetical protein TRUGW13939_02354 [Talaromyces rugulosus]